MAGKPGRLWDIEEAATPLLRQLHELVVKHANHSNLNTPVLEEWLLFFAKAAYLPPKRRSRELEEFASVFRKRLPNPDEIRNVLTGPNVPWDLKDDYYLRCWEKELFSDFLQTRIPVTLTKAFMALPENWLEPFCLDAGSLLLPSPPAFYQPLKTYSRAAELLENYLNQSIVGQEDAVHAAAQAVWESWIHPPQPGKVHKLITIAGPPAGGKTLLVKKLADFLRIPSRTIHCPHFSHPDSTSDLCGNNSVYNGARKGDITCWVTANSRSILVFDAPEQAALTVQSVIAEMASEGGFYDKFTQKRVDLSETIMIIVTSEGTQFAYRGGTIRSSEFLKAVSKSETLSPGLAQVMSSGSVVSLASLSEQKKLEIAASHLQRLFHTDYSSEKITADPQRMAMLTLCELGGLGSPGTLKEGISALFHRIARLASSSREATEIVVGFEQAPPDVAFYLDHKDPEQAARILRGRLEAVTYSLKHGSNSGHVVIGDFRLKNSSVCGELGQPGIPPSGSFDDVIGQDEAKSTLKTMISRLKNGEKGSVLFHGEPGTGKTLLARVGAAEGDVAFLSVAATELNNEQVGSGPAAIRRLFENARRNAPCIVFIDELDAIARDRKTVVAGASGHSESQTLIELLNQLDGFTRDEEPVLVIGATNIRDFLDPALLQRFEKHISFAAPAQDDRILFLRKALAHCGRKVQEDDLLRCAHFSSNLRELNSLVQIWKGDERETTLTEALFGLLYGAPTEHESDELAAHVAFHEAGHAVAATLLGIEPEYVSARARARSGGMVRIASPSTMTRDHIWALVVESMAGRCSENQFFGERGISTSSAADLDKARALVKTFLQLGFDKRLFADAESLFAMERADELLNKAMDEAQKLVEENVLLIKRFALFLLEKGETFEPAAVIRQLQKAA